MHHLYKENGDKIAECEFQREAIAAAKTFAQVACAPGKPAKVLIKNGRKRAFEIIAEIETTLVDFGDEETPY